ncbi:tyrosine-protein phosphatase [Novosphingobium sp. fls2-241-R2A-195]|uniref:tyrosine-protein phosphatase n=1 Tax=Novosphingobium sp. fls2-241-R2A-195 TaxID=3040296 RepID=UPI00254F459E|nr:tyrosine-protein phosphatase [Novosphingobium sp. fls2-241-R2A-195]
MNVSDRVMRFEGVHNFRDAGGYPLQSGGRIRCRTIWRSGQHYGASDADLERISALELASVFDLRTSKERTVHPCRRPAGFAARIVVAVDPVLRHAPHLAAARTTRQRTVQSTHDSLKRNYEGICFRPELQVMIRQWFDELARARGPSLVNCMAGKDRTGIAVAMLHAALGVHRDDIMADYLLTNSAGDVEARIASGAETIRAITGQLDDTVLRVLMGADAEYLHAAWTAIEDRCGSLEAYLEEALTLTPTKRDRLREVLGEN